MMKKTVIRSLTTLSFIAIVGGVAAQSDRMPAQAEKGMDKRTQGQEDSQARRSQRVQEVTARISSKVESRLAKYQEFLEKIQEKRALLSQEGADVTELDRLIRVAEDEFNNSRVAVTEMEAAFSSIDMSQAPREIIRVVTQDVQTVRVQFRTMHQVMRDIVNEIKSLS